MPEELVRAIRQVASRGKYASPFVAEKLASELDESLNRPAHERLSTREFQIMGMISSGRRVKEIAAELCLSPATIGTYRARILSRLDLQSNAEIVRYAVENNLT